MSSISIEVDRIRVATISLTGMEMVDVSVHGALHSAEKARLDASGGNYSVGGSGYLIWIAPRALLSGEILTVKFSDECLTGDQGKTIAQLYSNDPGGADSDFSINDKMATEIRARPQLYKDFTVRADTSSDQHAVATSNELNTDFSFSVLWHNVWSNKARVRLATYCSDDVLDRTGGTEHLQTMIDLGESASFILVQ